MELGRGGPLGAALLIVVTALAGPAGAFHQGSPHTGEVVIAILDSGIDPNHIEFDAGQIIGWRDFAGTSATPVDSGGHGTATASVAAGRNVGESPGTKLLIGRVCSPSACSTNTIRNGILWAVAAGADVINLSLSTSLPIPGLIAGLESALNHARSNGVLVVTSAGNGVQNFGLVPFPSELHQPSGSHLVLVVGASTEDGNANVGTSTDPELNQAGVDVLAANAGGGYVRLSGTSFSSPNVAGIAAEVQKAWFAEHGSYLSVDDLETFLKRTSIDTTAPPSLEGYGFLDKATSLAQVPNGMPQAPCTTPIQGLIPWSNYCHNALYVDTVADGVRLVW